MYFKNIFTVLILIGNGLLQIASDDEEDGQIKLAYVLHELSNVQTVFGKPESISFEEIKLMSVDCLTELVRQRYNDLRCSYLFSGRIYMRLVERLLVKVGQLRSIPNDQDLSFTNETAYMLATMHNVDALRGTGTKNVLWIFYLHTEIVWEHLKSMIAGEDGEEDHDVILDDLRSVKILFKKSLASDDCKPFCQKNNVDRWLENVNFKLKKTNTLLEEFSSTKELTMRCLVSNAQYKISTEGHHRFSLNYLSFNQVMASRQVLKNLTEKFQVHVEWRTILVGLRNQYSFGLLPNSNSLSDRIRSLTMFQDRFIQLTKVILLRLCLKHVTYEQGARNFERNIIASRYNFQLFDLISDFMLYLQLNDDGDLICLRDVFQKRDFTFKNRNYIPRIENILDNISPKLYESKLSDPMPLLHQKSCPLKRFTAIKCNTNDIRTYIEDIKTMLFDINVNVIRDFISIMHTGEYSDLIEIEDYIADKKRSCH